MNYIEQEIIQHQQVLEKMDITKVELAASICINHLLIGNKIISIGNGGSMSDAMHFASELSGRFRSTRPAISAIALSDPAAITCIANDFGYPQVFKRQVEAVGKQNDVLLCLSTSGNSENIIIAAEYAKRIGLKVIGITGLTGGKLRDYCDVCIKIPHDGDASRTQEITILLIHILVGLIERGV